MKNVTKTAAEVSVTPTTHGYARCSTNETKQDIDRQIRELRAAGALKIWTDYEHGDAETKEQQEAMWEATRPGDTVVVTEATRLARSVRQLCDIMDLVQAKHLRLQIIGSICLDCRTDEPDPMTVAFLQISGVFAQLELAMIRARVRSGVANARAKGKHIGRPPMTADGIPDSFFRYYTKLQAGEINMTELARLTCVSRPTGLSVRGGDPRGKKRAKRLTPFALFSSFSFFFCFHPPIQ